MSLSTGSSLIAWLLFIGSISAVSAPVIWAMQPRGRIGKAGDVFLGFLLGFPLFVLLSHIIFLVGALISPISLLPIYAIEWVLCFLWRRYSPSVADAKTLTPGQRIVIAYCGLLGTLYTLVLLAHTSPLYDGAMYWTHKGWAMAQSGDIRIFAATVAPTYPLAVPLGHAIFLTIGNPLGVALWQHLFLLGSLMYALTELARQRGWAGLVIGAAMFAPQMVFLPMAGQAHLMYADTTLAAALLVSVLLIERVFAGELTKLIPATIMLSFMCLTKVNVQVYFLIIASIIAAMMFRRFRQKSAEPKLAVYLPLVAIPSLVLIAWGIYGSVLHLPEAVGHEAWASLTKDILGSATPFQAYFYRLGLSLKFIFGLLALDKPSSSTFALGCGWIYPIALGSLFAWPLLRREEKLCSAISWGILFSIVAVTYCLVGSSNSLEARWWFETGYQRAIVHVFPLIVLAVEFILARLLEFSFREWRVQLPGSDGASRPGLTAKQRIALSVFPLALLPLFFISGDSSRGWERLRAEFLAAPTDADSDGLYSLESLNGEEFHWTSSHAVIKAQRNKKTAILRYGVAHSNISSSNPVTVSFLVDGTERAAVRREEKGVFTHALDLSQPGPAIARIEIKISPLWKNEHGQEVGVRLYDLKWSE